MPIQQRPLRLSTPARPASYYQLPSFGCFDNLFPSKFTNWRGDQPRAILTTIDSNRRFVAQAAPTGFGKSLMYVAIAQLTGYRTCILTSTKGLQEQLLTDFNGDGTTRLVDIRGQNAYRCIRARDFDLPEVTTCDYAPCHAGRRCESKDGGCLYYDQYRKAAGAHIVLTNYAYWMSINKYGQGLGDFDLLVLDEAHDAPDTLAEFMSVELSPDDLLEIGLRMMDPGCSMPEWRDWASCNLPNLVNRFERLKGRVRSGNVDRRDTREFSTLKRVIGKLEDLSVADDDWVTEKVEHGFGPSRSYRMRFDPVWPFKSAEKYVFRGIPHVLLVSATIRPKTAELLGIDSADLDFHEYDSAFPVARRPVIHVPTTQMNHRVTPEGVQTWLRRIDQIIGPRLDRKGIIHTVSFSRAKRVTESQYLPHMHFNETRNTKFIVELFKRAAPPSILVSPSVTTGYDFPYTECEYQIIGKLPFPDNRAKIVKARITADPDYSNYYTMQTLIQMCGRGMRATDDRCETLVIDDSIVWFMRNHARFAPRWFREAMVWATVLPPPPPRLSDPRQLLDRQANSAV